MDFAAQQLKQLLGSSMLLTVVSMSTYSYAEDSHMIVDQPAVNLVETDAGNNMAHFALTPSAAVDVAKPEVSSSRYFPIWGDEARAKGYELPEPFGAGYAYMRLHQDIIVDKIGFIMPNKPKNADRINIKAGATTQISESHLLRLDTWIFPFMNVYGLLGKTKGHSTTILEGGTYKPPFLKPKELPIQGMPFDLEFKGDTYGAGTTLAGGYKNTFAMVDINYTYADLDILDGEIKALVITPRIGYTFDLPQLIEGQGKSKLQLWAGAMYQDVTQSFQGNINDLDLSPRLKDILSTVADSDMKFSVDQHLAYKWNPLVGARLEITPHFNLTTEVGFNTRKTFMFSGEYRF